MHTEPNPLQSVSRFLATDLVRLDQIDGGKNMATRVKERVKIGYPGLGAKIRNARKMMNPSLSQERLGEIVGRSWMTIHRNEQDERAILYTHLEKIADATNQTMEYFLDTAPASQPVIYNVTLSGMPGESFGEWLEKFAKDAIVSGEPNL